MVPLLNNIISSKGSIADFKPKGPGFESRRKLADRQPLWILSDDIRLKVEHFCMRKFRTQKIISPAVLNDAYHYLKQFLFFDFY
jgi:hypothetical protein